MIPRFLLKAREEASRLASIFRTKGLILLYHRVADVPLDPWSLAVRPNNFRDHLEILRGDCVPMSLQTLMRASQDGTLTAGSVAITFDDGYADNLSTAKPLLERAGIPATVFVSSGALTDPQVFWWDTLQRMILEPGELPEVLAIDVDDREHRWVLGPASEFTASDAARFRCWRGLDEPPHPRLALYQDLWQLLRCQHPGTRRSLLQQLSSWSGNDLDPSDDDRPLRPQELRLLAEGGMIEIGAHTVTHPRLSSLSSEMQRREIRESKATLEELSDSPVSAFAYPHGSRSDYTRETVQLVREAGFLYACSVERATVHAGTDPLQIPRIYMDDQDADGFARLISRLLGLRVR
jgi:peptidoglycan/xylan/chitin deacetylase (PgdA/CDA1 family)